MTDNPQPRWTLEFCAGYFVPACSHLSSEEVSDHIQGSIIDVSTIPTSFFLPLFTTHAENAPVGVEFSPEDGQQMNQVRSLIRYIAFGSDQEKTDSSRQLAIRLASVTTKRSPDGLFVVLAGSSQDLVRVLQWKFPADETLRATIADSRLTIELIEDAFSRQNSYFKAAFFEGTEAMTSFWRGKVEDRQAKSRVTEVAEYWVLDFLTARPDMVPSRGSKILARALRLTIRDAPTIELREAGFAAALTAKGQAGRMITLQVFSYDYLPEALRESFLDHVGIPEILDSPFAIDAEALDSELKIKYIVLDEVYSVRGPLDTFDDFVTVSIPDNDGQVDVSLRGRLTKHAIVKR